MGKKRRSFSGEFKLEAVKLVKEGEVKAVRGRSRGRSRGHVDYEGEGRAPSTASGSPHAEDGTRDPKKPSRSDAPTCKNRNSPGRRILRVDRGERPTACWWLDPVKLLRLLPP